MAYHLLSCEFRSETWVRFCPITFQCLNVLGTEPVHGPENFAAFVGNTNMTDFGFVDNAAIFAESLDAFLLALEALHGDTKPLEI